MWCRRRQRRCPAVIPCDAGIGSHEAASQNMKKGTRMPNDWGNAMVVGRQEYNDEIALRAHYAQEAHAWERRAERRLTGGLIGWSAAVILCFGLFGALSSYHATFIALEECHNSQRQANTALETLALSHRSLMDANAQIGTVGEGSWTRRFIVTKYVPTAGGINADSDPTHTAT